MELVVGGDLVRDGSEMTVGGGMLEAVEIETVVETVAETLMGEDWSMGVRGRRRRSWTGRWRITGEVRTIQLLRMEQVRRQVSEFRLGTFQRCWLMRMWI
jgi:hypothetical protein